MEETPVLYLIDALPYVFRAYFAIRELTSPQGEPVQAVYGFATFLLQLLQQEPLTHVAVAFDESLTTSFRNTFFPAYKANRTLPPPELERQLTWCQAVARTLGLTVLVDQQYEADDLIGTLAYQATRQGLEVVVVSNDKDLMQLVAPTVTLYDFARQRRYTPAGVVAHLGVQPAQIPDLLGLQGDAVDNIPGVAGVGAKTARLLLQTFATLEALYAALERVETLPVRGAKTLRHRLVAGRDMAFLSKRLATIAVDAPVGCTVADLAYGGMQVAEMTSLFEQLGFQRLGQRVQRWQADGSRTSGPSIAPGNRTRAEQHER
jgi:5'-3' exonuclease